MKKNIFILGSINVDLVMKSSRIPVAGETLFGEGFFVNQGGKGANQAVAAAKLGGNVYMCGAVGADSFGEMAEKSLKNAGVNVDFVRKVEGVTTGTAVILLSDGDNRIILESGANAILSNEDVDNMLAVAKSGDVFLTQLENPIAVIGYALQVAKEKDMFVILNPAPANTQIVPYLPYCDLIIPNETELELLGGREFLLSKVDTVITTLGSKGFELATREGATVYPCKKIVPVDTTAAGDTLCGGLAAKLVANVPMREAAMFGSRAATIACTRQGAQSSIPTLQEVENL